MPANARALVPTVLPPMILDDPPSKRSVGPAVLPQMARASYVCLALALPSLGLTLTQGVPWRSATPTPSDRLVTLAQAERTATPDGPSGRLTEEPPRYRLSSLRAP